MNLILNSDDFGISKGMNLGVIDAHLEGVLSSTTALVGAPHINHGVNLAKDYPELGIGLHLSIDFFKCFSKKPSLIDENGNLKRFKANETRRIPVEDIVCEWELQIKEFENLFGYFPTHFDSHHHVHLRQPDCEAAMKILQDKYQVTVRGMGEAGYIGEFYDQNVKLECMKEYINRLRNSEYKYREIMIHNAFCDRDIISYTTYNTKRMDEHALITSNEFKKLINDENIKICSYKDGENE